MCGILGWISKSTDEKFFENSLSKISHRGPDGFGIWAGENNEILLGHRRLSILDLSPQGKQPMEFGKYVITFNGEIYNFLELRKELEVNGYKFRTDTDTEIILAAFSEWKEKCLEKFNGMWAFAIWDKQSKELFISRDRFGKKPLFYSIENNQLVFASEMKAITSFLKEIKPSKEFEWCKNHLFDYEGTDICLIEGIKRFPAGHYAYIKFPYTTISPVSFWDTLQHLVEPPIRYEEQVEEYRELFIDACKIRMRSDVPIGTALSGGLDSSATICTMAHIGRKLGEARTSNDWQHGFVATFPDTFLDEKVYAKKVVDYLGINATYIPIDPKKNIDTLFHKLYLFEELYLTSPIPMMETYGKVKQSGVSVTIDGHGADELLSGYGADLLKAVYDAGINWEEIKSILNTYKGLYDTDSPELAKIKQELGSNWNLLLSAYGGKRNVTQNIIRNLTSRKENPVSGEFGKFNSHLFKLFHKSILPTLLRNYDRYAMANGVEIRMPFMDHRLVSYTFSLSWKSKIRNGYTKAIMRDALKDIMPQEIVWRKSKIGFNTPIVNWMKGDWKEFLLDEIHSLEFKQSSLINSSDVASKVKNVINNPNAQYTEGEQAWTSLTPYFWEKGFLKEAINNAK